MARTPAAQAVLDLFDDDATAPHAADVLDLDGVAARRERFAAHAAAASRVAVYEFRIAPGATVKALGAGAGQRDAHDQLMLAVALTGGAVGKFPGGLRARVPVAAVQRFEALAAPLIDAFMIAFQREAPGGGNPA